MPGLIPRRVGLLPARKGLLPAKGCVSTPVCDVVIHATKNFPCTFNFSATSSTQIISYLWQFGDNSTSTDPAPQHTYAAGQGSFIVTLQATLQGGLQCMTGYNAICGSISCANYCSPAGVNYEAILIVDGITNEFCDICDAVNGALVLQPIPNFGSLFAGCRWIGSIYLGQCNLAGSCETLGEVSITYKGSLEIIKNIGQPAYLESIITMDYPTTDQESGCAIRIGTYRKDLPTSQCRGTHVLNLISQSPVSGIAVCGSVPPTITAII